MLIRSACRRHPLRAVLSTVLVLGACRPSDPARLAAAVPDSAAVRSDIAFLADDRLEGRATGTAGNDSAAAYLTRRYAAMGLAATAQPFTAHAPVRGSAPLALPSQNIYAIAPGTDQALKTEYLIIGAHFDHLGRSTNGALDPEAGAVIRNGADDNASGTAAVLSLARRFARKPARRSIVFANFTGEELGLLGSAWFADHAPVPLDRVQAMLNFDMVGRLRNDKLIVYGVASATELKPLVDSANTGLGLKISAVGDGFGPSDQSSFYAKNIPVLHFFTDLHDEYHRAGDKAATIDAAGEVRVVDLAERIARSLADRPARLTFQRPATTQASRASSSERQGSGVYLGSIPDMGAADVAGMKLSGVRAGSPADLGGLKGGDIIVEFGGTPVKDIYSYTDALGAFKPGDAVKIVVLRGSERLTLTVTLGKRAG
jgi:hypothetical protein